MPVQKSRLRCWLKRSLVTASVLVVAWLAVSAVVAYKLTRRPHAPFAEPAPAVSWATIEPLRLRACDDVEIGAWFMPGSDEGPSVIVLHGYGRCRRDSLGLAEMLAHEGYSVLAITLRAHGDSGGDVNDIGYSARHDVVAAVDYLEQRRPGRPIFVQGESLGAATAIYAGGELQTRVAGYILECPFRDIRSAVRNRTTAFLPFPLSDIAYAGLDVVGPIFLPNIEAHVSCRPRDRDPRERTDPDHVRRSRQSRPSGGSRGHLPACRRARATFGLSPGFARRVSRSRRHGLSRVGSRVSAKILAF